MTAPNAAYSFQPIGDLMQKFRSCAPNSEWPDRPSTSSLLNSSPTGRELASPAQTGTPRSATALSVRAAAEQGQLDRVDNHAVDEAIKAYLESRKTLSVHLSAEPLYHAQYGFLRVRETWSIDACGDDDIAKMRAFLERICAPAGPELVLQQVLGMALAMAKRAMQADDYKAQAAIYADDLAEYPEDVILHVCRAMRRGQRIFPIVKEMRDACEERVEFRRDLLRQLVAGRFQRRAIEAQP